MSINPLQLSFYKGAGGKHGAIQFNLQKPHYYVKSNPKLKNYNGKFIPEDWLMDNPHLTRDDLSSREGALFLEICSTKGANEYNWEKKIVMALSIHDMGKVLTVLEGLKKDVDIMHDPGAKSSTAGEIRKKLIVNSPEGIKSGVIVTVTMKDKSEETTKHTVPLSCEEARVLAICIRSFIPVALGWL